jgi:Tol biopolymer transport system component/DNA-binding winged helix-turn-helix (wHTH) protein
VTDYKPFVFRFGEFEVREREFLLIRAGEAVPVEPKAFRVLLFLLRNRGRLVTKDEILNAVWSDYSVSDNSLTRSIATLRRLLGDDSREPRYIATVQTIGYRFLSPVEVLEGLFAQPEGSVSLPTSDPESKLQPIEERRLSKRLVFVLAVAALLLAGGWILRRSITSRATATGATNLSPIAVPSSGMRTVPLTNLSGAVWAPAFSPDARQVAFIWDGEGPGPGDLYVQLVGGDKPLRLTHSTTGFTSYSAWSPDGRQIAFGRCDDNGGAVYIVPALGGPKRKITEVACPYGNVGSLNWTSDGKSLVLADRCVQGGPIGVVVFSMETGAKRCLTAPTLGEGQSDSNPALSPNQQTVAFIRFPTAAVSDLYTVPLAGGSPRRLTAENKSIWGLMWAADGQSLSFVSSRGGLERTWRVSATGGTIEPETRYPGIGALSRDGGRLAYVEPQGFWGTSSALWRADLSSPVGTVSKMRQLLPTSAEDSAPHSSPDGHQIAFESMRSGSLEIWKCNADGSDPLKLTSFEGHAGTPRWSPDGKWIAFDYRPSGQSQIFVIDEEGRNLHSVTSGNYENLVPSWSSDGKSIYFASNRTGALQIWRRELASGRETQVTYHGGFAGFESYDGRTLYFSKFDGAGIWSISVAGGEEQRLTQAPHLGYWGYFAVTEEGLYLVDSDAEGGPALMYYNSRTRQLTRILTLNGGQHAVPWTANLGASRDGRTVFFAQGTTKSSIVLAENLQ